MLLNKPDPEETIEILDELLDGKLITGKEFRDKHHLGGSIAGFRRYCSTVKTFVPDGNNHRIQEWLRSKLVRCSVHSALSICALCSLSE
jgi:hypothetical protein